MHRYRGVFGRGSRATLVMEIATVVISILLFAGVAITQAEGRDYAAVVGSYGIDAGPGAGALILGRMNGDVRGELGIGLNGDRVAKFSLGGGYRLVRLFDRLSLWATTAIGYQDPQRGAGAPFMATGMSVGVPLGDRYGLSVGYTYSRNLSAGTGGGAVGLRFTMFLDGP